MTADPEQDRARPWVVALVLLGTFVALMPVAVVPWSTAWLRRPPEPPRALALLAWSLPVLTVVACWLRVPLDLDRRRKAVLFGSLVALAAGQVALHWALVDRAPFVYARARFEDNTGWQVLIQRLVLDGVDHITIAGHNARFLPNGLTQWLVALTGDYAAARAVYRLAFQFLLLLAIYALGRRWYSHAVAFGGVVVYAAIYPASIRHYAGQLTDPMSHLSLVLGLLLLARGPLLYLLLCLTVGAIAKETVVILAPLYVVFRPDDPRRWPKAAALLGAGLLVVWLLRWAVTGAVTEEGLSGQSWAHVRRNWAEWPVWLPGLLATLWPAALLPVMWRRTPLELRWTIAWLTLVLLAAGLRFSWLREARNLVPAAIPMGIVAAAWLLERRSGARAAPGGEPPGAAGT